MGYITSADCTLTNERTPESPRSSSCVTRPYSTFDIPAQPYPFRLAPKKPSSPIGLTSSRGKRPARLPSSMMGMRLSSMNLRAVSRTRRSSSVRSVSKSMKSTPRNFMAIRNSILSPSSRGAGTLARVLPLKACPEAVGQECPTHTSLADPGKRLTLAEGKERVKPAEGIAHPIYNSFTERGLRRNDAWHLYLYGLK